MTNPNQTRIRQSRSWTRSLSAAAIVAVFAGSASIATAQSPPGEAREPATFVSMEMPEGATIGSTLTVDVVCSRAITADDQAWLVLRNVTNNSNLFHTSPGMFRYTESGFRVVLPMPITLTPGVYEAGAGCAGPREWVGNRLPAEVAGPTQRFFIRADKEYSAFVSITPNQATVGSEVTFTVTCSLPPENASLAVGRLNGPILVDANTPDEYQVNGSTFSVTTTIGGDIVPGEYSMRAGCDGPNDDSGDYFPPPTSYSPVLPFSVLGAELPASL